MEPMRVWNTQLKNYRRCKFKWYLSDVLSLECKIPFQTWLRGEMGHKGLEWLYIERDFHTIEIVEDVLSRYPDLKLFEEEKADYEVFLAERLTGYIEHYGDHDNAWMANIIGTEVEWQVPLMDGAILLEGVFDLVFYTPESELVIMDHKFTGTPYQTDHLVMDPQGSTYFFGASHMFGQVPQAFVINNVLNKKAPAKSKYPEPRFNREPVLRTLYEQERFMEETIQQILDMSSVRELFERTGRRSMMYRNPTKDCSWDCEFHPLCICDLKGGDVESMSSEKYRRREVRVGRG